MLSPLLFNLMLLICLCVLVWNHEPVTIGKYMTNVLMYGDDLVLMSVSKEGL